MSNIVRSKIEGKPIKEFLVSSLKQLLVSQSTKTALEEKELPLVQIGPTENYEETIAAPIEVGPETPLVKGDPNNIFIKTGSIANGFDVTEPTPINNVPNNIESPIAKSIVNESILTDTPKREIISSPLDEKDADSVIVEQAINNQIINPIGVPIENEPSVEKTPILETPQIFNNSIEEKKAIDSKTINPYIEINVEIEKVRAYFNYQINDLLKKIKELENEMNQNLNNISRNVEKARQISQNDSNAIKNTIQSGINSFSEEPSLNYSINR